MARALSLKCQPLSFPNKRNIALWASSHSGFDGRLDAPSEFDLEVCPASAAVESQNAPLLLSCCCLQLAAMLYFLRSSFHNLLHLQTTRSSVSIEWLRMPTDLLLGRVRDSDTVAPRADGLSSDTASMSSQTVEAGGGRNWWLAVLDRLA